MRTLFFAAAALALAFAHAQTATFIGNCAFKFQLGEATLYTDFPYQSGFFNNNTYPPEALQGLSGTTLITHEHLDHLDPSLLPSKGLQVISPTQEQGVRDKVIAELGERSGIYVYPISTPHADVPHFSYIVQWNRRRMFFSGDTDDPKELLSAQNIDVAFITPKLLAAVNATGRKIDARTVIIYHHKTGELDSKELQAPCDCKMTVPQQGDVIRLFR